MNDIEFIFIGWCNTGTHDKVWCSFHVGPNYYAGWGRRGKKLRFKRHHNEWNLMFDLTNKKRRDYNEVDEDTLITMFPDFKEEVEKYLTFDLMSNKVM